jgi:hypothetical protein
VCWELPTQVPVTHGVKQHNQLPFCDRVVQGMPDIVFIYMGCLILLLRVAGIGKFGLDAKPIVLLL